ncbi:MAG: ABC transporter permease [Coriobacteriales bacterium]|jgi:simple sugar transport system permease protein|nr:ABC transporter permease [Coriobacteriales bacterium]
MSAVKTKREPLLRMVKRDDLAPRRAWAFRGIAFVAALITGGLLIAVLGHNPLLVYKDMIVGSWGSPTVIKETVKLAIPLLICALGLALAFKMKFWNIGGEGQVIVGAIAAGYFGFFMADFLTRPMLIAVMFIAGVLAGGIYGLIPAFFKARWNTNETLFTLMLNYVALAVIKYLMNGPWKAPGSSFPKMPMLVPGGRLTTILGVHWGWILALILIVVAWFYFNRTKQGYELAVVGESENTARYVGINVRRVIMRTMFLSGALCGLVGFLQFAGADYTITEGIAGGVGFTAITVAWLAKMNPFGMLVVSVFIAMLERGSNTIQTIYKIPASASSLLIGIILFFMLGCEFFITYRLVWRGKGVADAEDTNPSVGASVEATGDPPVEKGDSAVRDSAARGGVAS